MSGKQQVVPNGQNAKNKQGLKLSTSIKDYFKQQTEASFPTGSSDFRQMVAHTAKDAKEGSTSHKSDSVGPTASPFTTQICTHRQKLSNVDTTISKIMIDVEQLLTYCMRQQQIIKQESSKLCDCLPTVGSIYESS